MERVLLGILVFLVIVLVYYVVLLKMFTKKMGIDGFVNSDNAVVKNLSPNDLQNMNRYHFNPEMFTQQVTDIDLAKKVWSGN